MQFHQLQQTIGQLIQSISAKKQQIIINNSLDIVTGKIYIIYIKIEDRLLYACKTGGRLTWVRGIFTMKYRISSGNPE